MTKKEREIAIAIVTLAIADLLTDIMAVYAIGNICPIMGIGIITDEDIMGMMPKCPNCPHSEGVDTDTDTDKHPLIGRRYRVEDNANITDKATGCKGYLKGRETTIVSDPYVDVKEAERMLMVDVFSTDSARDYEVPFREDWLIDEE